MRAATLTNPAITPQSPKEPAEIVIKLSVTRAELEEYFLYDNGPKRRMSRRMATHLRKMVVRAEHKELAERILPPGWFEALHEPKLPNTRRGAAEGAPYTPEQHQQILQARHIQVMRAVAGEQAKARAIGGDRRA